MFDQKKYTLADFKDALENNFGKGLPKPKAEELTRTIVAELINSGKPLDEQLVASVYKTVVEHKPDPERQAMYDALLKDIEALPRYGNDVAEVDLLARDAAYIYTRELEKYKNPRGGIFQAGLYPVSANVPLGAQTGATPDGRLASTPIADGVSPAAGRDTNGPTAACNSVAKIDHFIASNGTLFNMKFHPSALQGQGGLESFISLIRGTSTKGSTSVQHGTET